MSFSVLDEDRNEDTFNLRKGNYFPEEEKKSFTVGFKLKIRDRRFDLDVEALFYFSLNEDITEEFKLSTFPKINAPAIAFPYLRAFISNLTLQSGFDPIILPSINFVSMENDGSENDDEE